MPARRTLLRALAGIYPPVSGTIEIEGTTSALLTAGLGMREDISGFDNIEFCLLLQGNAAYAEIPERREEIAAFTELGDYLNLHVGAYSAGMRFGLPSPFRPRSILRYLSSTKSSVAEMPPSSRRPEAICPT